MRTIKVQELSAEAFSLYGSFSDFLYPKEAIKLGEEPSEFYRDALQVTLGVQGEASFSVGRVSPRPWVADVLEYHDGTGEGMMPLDGDVVLCFAPASLGDDPPVEKMQAFRIPQGTMVAIRPGVWHCAAYPWEKQPVHMMIVLPERTYAVDCKVVSLKEESKVLMEE